MLEQLMQEYTLLRAGWTPEAIENMDTHMFQARYMVTSFMNEIEMLKGSGFG